MNFRFSTSIYTSIALFAVVGAFAGCSSSENSADAPYETPQESNLIGGNEALEGMFPSTIYTARSLDKESLKEIKKENSARNSAVVVGSVGGDVLVLTALHGVVTKVKEQYGSNPDSAKNVTFEERVARAVGQKLYVTNKLSAAKNPNAANVEVAPASDKSIWRETTIVKVYVPPRNLTDEEKKLLAQGIASEGINDVALLQVRDEKETTTTGRPTALSNLPTASLELSVIPQGAPVVMTGYGCEKGVTSNNGRNWLYRLKFQPTETSGRGEIASILLKRYPNAKDWINKTFSATEEKNYILFKAPSLESTSAAVCPGDSGSALYRPVDGKEKVYKVVIGINSQFLGLENDQEDPNGDGVPLVTSAARLDDPSGVAPWLRQLKEKGLALNLIEPSNKTN
jgi:Trypsin-like peptidase domain